MHDDHMLFTGCWKDADSATLYWEPTLNHKIMGLLWNMSVLFLLTKNETYTKTSPKLSNAN